MQAKTQAGADLAPPAKAPTITVVTDAGNGAVTSQVLQIPTSHNEMMALLARRRQLSDQLNSVTDRRDGLIEQMKQSPQPAQAGLEAQLNVLDTRILQLENDLGVVGREIAASSPQLMAMAEEPTAPPGGGDDFQNGVGAGVAGSVGVLAVLTVVWLRRWKRSPRRSQPLMPAADSERLQRLEHGMEAMAIEIERISEGQRFVTKLLSESRGVESAPR